MKKPRDHQASDRLQVREIGAFIAVRGHSERKSPLAGVPNANGWLYLSQHSETELFIGNIPQPKWLAVADSGMVSPSDQARFKKVLRKMVPGALSIGDVFGLGNNRLATRVHMSEPGATALSKGKNAVRAVLSKPDDHLYVNWEQLVSGGESEEEGVVEQWIREYHASRDERGVAAWGNAAMQAFEAGEKQRAEEKERKARQGAVPDEDGFITVTSGAPQMKAEAAKNLGTRGKSRPGNYKSKSGKNRKSLLDVSKGIEKAGFYRFQRENKSNLVELQKKFKEDQKRIAAVRALDAEKE